MRNYESFAAIVLLIALIFQPVNALEPSSENGQVEFLNANPANAALPFSDAVKVGKTLYLSGQIAIQRQRS